MQLACVCKYVIMCVVLIVVILTCDCIYFLNKQNAYMPVVCVYVCVCVCVWGGGGLGGGGGRCYVCVCVRERCRFMGVHVS